MECLKKQEFPWYNCIDYEIYKLKGIDDKFYIAYIIYNTYEIEIYKYTFSEKKFVKIGKSNVGLKIKDTDITGAKIKYCCNSLNNKEYLFMAAGFGEIKTVLIKNENKYELIKK